MRVVPTASGKARPVLMVWLKYLMYVIDVTCRVSSGSASYFQGFGRCRQRRIRVGQSHLFQTEHSTVRKRRPLLEAAQPGSHPSQRPRWSEKEHRNADIILRSRPLRLFMLCTDMVSEGISRACVAAGSDQREEACKGPSLTSA